MHLDKTDLDRWLVIQNIITIIINIIFYNLSYQFILFNLLR